MTTLTAHYRQGHKIKQLIWTILFMLIPLCGLSQYSGGGEANPDLETNKKALKEFQDMRFGMFIHWGPVSIKGEEISWSRGREIPKNEYDQLYGEFNPELFNATDWVATAKAAGMQYIIITSRHHDGFSLWDSEFTDYDMAATPYGRGVLKELADACEKQRIKFGTYYSICDWYRDDYPVDYPAPDYTFNEARSMDSATQEQMDQYITFMKNQLKELVRDFNTFLLWFDGEWEWAWTHEMGTDMYAYLRGMKDDILINNRVDKGREGMEDKTRSARFAGDFATPEQQVGAFDNKYAWETCMTIGEQWAWKPDDKLKSGKECIHTLLQTIGGDGNLLFNVGPMPDGRIESRQVDRLKEIGHWLSINGEAVYGTRGGPYLPTGEMISTHKENLIYLHLLARPGRTLVLPLAESITVYSVRFLQDNTALKFKRDKGSITLRLPNGLPDEVATVIELSLDKPASDIEPIKL